MLEKVFDNLLENKTFNKFVQANSRQVKEYIEGMPNEVQDAMDTVAQSAEGGEVEGGLSIEDAMDTVYGMCDEEGKKWIDANRKTVRQLLDAYGLFESTKVKNKKLEDGTEEIGYTGEIEDIEFKENEPTKEGKNSPGKQDGTGPYKNSTQRKISGNKGKKQPERIKSLPENWTSLDAQKLKELASKLQKQAKDGIDASTSKKLSGQIKAEQSRRQRREITGMADKTAARDNINPQTDAEAGRGERKSWQTTEKLTKDDFRQWADAAISDIENIAKSYGAEVVDNSKGQVLSGSYYLRIKHSPFTFPAANKWSGATTKDTFTIRIGNHVGKGPKSDAKFKVYPWNIDEQLKNIEQEIAKRTGQKNNPSNTGIGSQTEQSRTGVTGATSSKTKADMQKRIDAGDKGYTTEAVYQCTKCHKVFESKVSVCPRCKESKVEMLHEKKDKGYKVKEVNAACEYVAEKLNGKFVQKANATYGTGIIKFEHDGNKFDASIAIGSVEFPKGKTKEEMDATMNNANESTENLSILAKGISDKALADTIAKQKNAMVIADPDDNKKFAIATKGENNG